MNEGNEGTATAATTAPVLPHRARLLALAYRMLGSWAEAEDVVQDAHMRFLSADAVDAVNHAAIASPRAWLERVVTNLCLDQLKSARARRETYVGPWLPEPVVTAAGCLAGEPIDPETISLAFLTLLERLSPLERAVYVLAEAFDYAPDEIGAVLGKEAAAVRQTLHRAREHVRAGRPRFAPDREAHGRLLHAFAAACVRGEVAGVERLLAGDVVARSDGGGQARAARKLVHGSSAVARLMVGLVKKASPTLRAEVLEVNGWPALVTFEGETPTTVTEIETDGARIFTVSMVVSPEKLRAILAHVAHVTG